MDEDEDYSYYEKPRLRLASGPATREGEGEQGEASTAVKAISCSVGVALIALGVLVSGIPQFFAFWFALAFLVGPFSPVRITGGDCRVGVGEPMDFSQEEEEEALAAASIPVKGSSASKALGASKPPPVPTIKDRSSLAASIKAAASSAKVGLPPATGRGDWSRAEWDQLRKLLVKFPRGTPQRWEAVARGLGTKRSTEEVSAVAKFMAECADKDPFAAFQIQAQASAAATAAAAAVAVPAAAKPDTTQAGAAKAGAGAAVGSGAWTAAQERALLLAVKEFPKETAQRWDRVAQAVPGRNKAECFRRFSELRDTFKAKRAVDGAALEPTADASLAEALQEP